MVGRDVLRPFPRGSETLRVLASSVDLVSCCVGRARAPVWVFRSFFSGLGPLRAWALGGHDRLCFGVEWLFECLVSARQGEERLGV